MKKILVAMFLAATGLTNSASAMSMPVWRPGGEYYQPEDNTKVLVIHRKSTETLILQPSWKASTKDFGLIIPVPAKPTLGETDESIFDELETLTNNQRYWIYPMMKEVSAAPQVVADGVTLVEKRDVGRMTASVLTATNKQGLTMWLTQNGYTLGAFSDEAVDGYIKQGGYYFIALKVNVDTQNQMGTEYYYGRLNPITITFATQKPYLPTRSMYGVDKNLNFTIYTLSDKPHYIDGSELQFVRPLTTSDLQSAPVLKKYARSGDWLSRSLVTFEPKNIKKDILFREGNRAIRITDIQKRRAVNVHMDMSEYGINTASLATPLFSGKGIQAGITRTLKQGSTGTDVKILQAALRAKGYLGEENMTGVYDVETVEAVRMYQEENRETILKSAKLEEGNGYLGALTRKTLNKEFFK